MSSKPGLTITFSGGKRVDAELNGTVIRTDQSIRAGGDASAPEPFALFLASIGTCAGIYVLSFLQTRGLPSDGVRIHERLTFDQSKGTLSGVELEIEVPESIPAKYHSALVRAADQCAVKKAIQAPLQFDVHVATADQAERYQVA